MPVYGEAEAVEDVGKRLARLRDLSKTLLDVCGFTAAADLNAELDSCILSTCRMIEAEIEKRQATAAKNAKMNHPAPRRPATEAEAVRAVSLASRERLSFAEALGRVQVEAADTARRQRVASLHRDEGPVTEREATRAVQLAGKNAITFDRALTLLRKAARPVYLGSDMGMVPFADSNPPGPPAKVRTGTALRGRSLAGAMHRPDLIRR